jgi:protein-disulfide isomerase
MNIKIKKNIITVMVAFFSVACTVEYTDYWSDFNDFETASAIKPDTGTGMYGDTSTQADTDSQSEMDPNLDLEFCKSDIYLKFKATKPYVIYTSMAPSIGNNTDPEVVIVGYSYFGCPHCQHWSEDVNEIFKDTVIRKRAVYYFKHYPFAYDGLSWNGHRAAFAAHVQNKFWPMHDKIFEHMGDYTEQDLKDWASELGLNMERFNSDYTSEANAQIIKNEKEYAKDNYNVHGTPTIFINGIKPVSRKYTAQIVHCLLYENDHNDY